MRISMRTDYGVRAVTDLAQHYGRGLIQCRDIANRQRIPENYLDQLMTDLRKAGLVKSTRGPAGGHQLARPPAEVTMGQVVEALEGPLFPIGCLDASGNCALSPNCAQREVWAEIHELTRRVLDSTTVEDLARRQQHGREEVRYYI
ncbi:MAG: Rrf2 family transcriptional regulator [Chloroflexi bacterium]|nr:Rrf2 family transcriptional regulator [Chloroflexota bacterium]